MERRNLNRALGRSVSPENIVAEMLKSKEYWFTISSVKIQQDYCRNKGEGNRKDVFYQDFEPQLYAEKNKTFIQQKALIYV